MKGKTTRLGLWKCRACRKPFTVRIGTVFESSHVPMHIWLQAIYLICCGERRVENSHRYQLLAAMRRQSRAASEGAGFHQRLSTSTPCQSQTPRLDQISRRDPGSHSLRARTSERAGTLAKIGEADLITAESCKFSIEPFTCVVREAQ